MRKCVLILALVATPACGSDDLQTPQECNPLGGMNCITPWPSGIYEIEDSSTLTGRRLDIPEGALPTSLDGIPIEPAPFNERDGFSAAAPIITAFETGIDPSNLVHYSDYAASVTDASPTILINMVTGERVVHFAEIDARVPEQPEKQALFLRPSTRLQPGTRYAVALRKTLKARDGSDLPVPEGYQALLDDTATDHDLFERVRPRYDAIFAALEEQGIDRADLVTAWDFTTASDESQRRDILAARDAAMPAIGDAGANLTFAVDSDRPRDDGSVIAREIEGTFEAPLFLTQGGSFGPSTEMARDSGGDPDLQGMYDIFFAATVPACASARSRVPMIVYGHGLMGKADEVTHGAIRKAADRLCMVIVGTNWRGMSSEDLVNVANALNDANKGPSIFDAMVQGIVNFIALEQIMRGPMAEQLFVDAAGESIVDPTQVYYYGNSQGGIFGGTFMAYDPYIERGVLGVGAANYSMMLERSQDWPVYRLIMIGAYPDPLDVTILLSLMQMQWDRTEPVGTISSILDEGIPGTPPKQLLLHMAVADDEVSNVATEYEARTLGIPTLAPAVYEPFGVPEMSGPLDSALVIWDGGDGPLPPTNTPPEDNDAHSMPRNAEAALRQMETFFTTGEIVHTCGDATPCDCTTGACD